MRNLMNRVTAAAVAASFIVGLGLTTSVAHADASTNVVYAWGVNDYGQVGNGTTTFQHNNPVLVPELTDVTAVVTGWRHSLAVLSDGSVRAWGANYVGQLGDGTTVNRNIPLGVSGLTGTTAIGAGIHHSMGLLSDGTVRTWGDNTFGQLGNGTFGGASSIPTSVSGLTNVTSITAGGHHALALISDGTVRAWGYNANGELGNGASGGNSNVPVTVSELANVTTIAAGTNHSLALLSDGTVRAWGSKNNGKLGDGTFSGNNGTPATVAGLTNVTAIAAGSNHSLAVLSDGTVRAWGLNSNGQLGDNTITNRSVPVTVPGLSNITDVAATFASSFALSADGRLWSWGWNQYGTLGVGDTADHWIPTEVLSPLPGYRFSAISIGKEGSHVLTILSPIPSPGTAAVFGFTGLLAACRRRAH